MTVARRPHRALLAAPFAALTLALCLPLARQESTPTRRENDLDNQLRVEHELDNLGRILHRRKTAKIRIALELRQGRIGLLDAASSWLVMNRQDPFNWEEFRAAWPGASDEERICRMIIDMAADGLSKRDDPCLALAFRAGLERELQGHLTRGPLSLPQPSAMPAE